MNEIEKETVLLTGFGPFGKHVINASWEAVKKCVELGKDLESTYNVKITCQQVTVCYEEAKTVVPSLWKEHKPIIVIHVGVSHQARCLTIEGRAHSIGYVRKDINDQCPNENNMSYDILEPAINIEELCNEINDNFKDSGCKAITSTDMGLYLCEYTFYQSLSIDRTRVIFIHVPDFDVYTTEQSAKGILDIVNYLLKYAKNHPEEFNIKKSL